MIIYEIKLKADHSKNYIGQTIRRNPQKRWAGHKSNARNGNTSCPHLYHAMRKYGIGHFEFTVLDSSAKNQQQLDNLEILYKNICGDYYGIKAGGRGGAHNEESKCKMSEACKGRKHSEETKRRISESLKLRYTDLEARRKLSEALIGNTNARSAVRTVEERLKMSKRMMGNTRAKGRVHTTEELHKMTEAHKGKKHSKETRQKISEAQKGRHFSTEHRRKLSEAHKLRWATKKNRASIPI